MNYWIFECNEESKHDGALIEYIPGDCPAEWRFNKGISLKDEFPNNVNLNFSSNRPDNRKLYDFVNNTLSFIIASERVKKVVEQHEKNVEFLPVSILDHKGNVADENYFIINLLGSQPAVDMEKSTYKMGNIDPDQMKRIDDLQLNEDAIDSEATFFREKNDFACFCYVTISMRFLLKKVFLDLRFGKQRGGMDFIFDRWLWSLDELLDF